MNQPSPFRPLQFSRSPEFFCFFFPGSRLGARVLCIFCLCFTAGGAIAETNSPAATAPPFPDAGVNLLRVMGALALVLGLFLAGAWLFKNWQRFSTPRGRQPRLNILETRSLGARQAVFVVAYERQRFLVATSPAGVNLLSHLPETEAAENEPADKPAGPMSFGQALVHVLKRK